MSPPRPSRSQKQLRLFPEFQSTSWVHPQPAHPRGSSSLQGSPGGRAQQTSRLKTPSLAATRTVPRQQQLPAHAAVIMGHVINEGTSLLQSLWTEIWVTRSFCGWRKERLLHNSTRSKSSCAGPSHKRRATS